MKLQRITLFQATVAAGPDLPIFMAGELQRKRDRALRDRAVFIKERKHGVGGAYRCDVHVVRELEAFILPDGRVAVIDPLRAIRSGDTKTKPGTIEMLGVV